VSVPAGPHFAVEHRRFGDRAVVTVSGELDIATVPQLYAVLAIAVGPRPAALWIDLSATTFIDSSGLHALFEARRRFGGALAIICPPRVRRVFEIVGLDTTVPLYDDAAAARSALESSRSKDARNRSQAV
jgi:anti-sigma B factor antagonist